MADARCRYNLDHICPGDTNARLLAAESAKVAELQGRLAAVLALTEEGLEETDPVYSDPHETGPARRVFERIVRAAGGVE